MPLVKENLKAKLQKFFEENNKTPEKAADELAGILTDYIKTATVKPGIPVSVVVPAGTGSTTGPGSLT